MRRNVIRQKGYLICVSIFLLPALKDGFGVSISKIWMIRTTPWGDTLWTQTYERGEDTENIPIHVSQTDDAGFLIVAETDSIMYIQFSEYDDSLPVESGRKYWILKTDSLGIPIWSHLYDSKDTGRVFKSIDDRFFTLGSGYVIEFKDFNPSVFNITSSNDTIWTGSYEGGYIHTHGDMTNTSNQGFVYKLERRLIREQGRFIDVLQRISSQGNIQWEREFDPYENNQINYISASSDKGCLVTGYDNEFEPWVAKIDSFGNTVWEHTYDVGEEYVGDGICINEAEDSSCYVLLNFSYENSPKPPFYSIYRINPKGHLSRSFNYSGKISFIEPRNAYECLVLHSRNNGIGLSLLNDEGDQPISKFWESELYSSAEHLITTHNGDCIIVGTIGHSNFQSKFK